MKQNFNDQRINVIEKVTFIRYIYIMHTLFTDVVKINTHAKKVLDGQSQIKVQYNFNNNQ